LPGLAALLALVFTYQQVNATNVQLQIAEQGQITDRYNAAITNLGSPSIEVRLGGIYALQRLMQDSPRDQPTVIAVLCAFVRDQTALTVATASSHPAPPTDIQATLTVIVSRNTAHDGTTTVVDFDRAQLANSQLYRADLARADLAGANLAGANLTGADLTGADLTGADLAGADLTGADLNGAALHGADLKHANLDLATVEANLVGADLTHATLVGATLADAEAATANLTGAIMTSAHLAGADLYRALKGLPRTPSSRFTASCPGPWP
jgi:hypothetical protein